MNPYRFSLLSLIGVVSLIATVFAVGMQFGWSTAVVAINCLATAALYSLVFRPSTTLTQHVARYWFGRKK